MEVEQQQQLASFYPSPKGRLESSSSSSSSDVKPSSTTTATSVVKIEADKPRIRLASSVVSVATIIKTEPSVVSLGLNGRSRSNSSATPSPTPTVGGAMHHPISMSILQQQQQSPFYSGVTSPASSAPSPGSSSSNAASPLKRIRHVVNNNNNNPTAMEDWLPSPGQMSVDSMSPPPPSQSSSSSMIHQTGSTASGGGGLHHHHHHHLQSSSNGGYSPSPMSTGSYEPPYSPAGSSSHASITPATLKSGREDLSPPGSVNGVGSGGAGYSTDGYVGGGGGGRGGGSDSKKKKGPVPRQQEELCLVCGDRASGYHYNALTCEGCKGFFRRSITKNAVYQCKYGNGCDIDMYMRRKCQECRLKKCLTVGMRPECVVPEYQCAVKREAKKAQKEKDRPSSSAMGSPTDNIIKEQNEVKTLSSVPSAASSVVSPHHHQVNHHHHHLQQQQQAQPMMIHVTEEKPMSVGSVTGGGSSVGTPMGTIQVKPLSPEQEELINRLVYFQEEFDQPSEEDLRKISSSGMHESESEAKFKHITEMTILTVQLTVEFSKRLPGFDTLLREDQITLLKACSSEVMMLRCARRYDANTDSIVFANNLPYTRDSYNVAGVGDNAEPLFRFGKQMSTMKVDNAEYALITAIVIFSERPGLVEARKVEKIQEIYLEALQAYVMNHRVRPMTEFAKLLSVLTELRTLGNLNSEMCFSLKLKNKKLPPFLAEIWDVHS